MIKTDQYINIVKCDIVSAYESIIPCYILEYGVNLKNEALEGQGKAEQVLSKEFIL